MVETVKTREEIAREDTWNVEQMFCSWASFDSQWKEFTDLLDQELNGLQAKKGTLKNNPSIIAHVLSKSHELQRRLEYFYTFAHLKNDENTRCEEGKSAYGKVSTTYYQFASQIAWIEPEILEMKDEELLHVASSQELSLYEIYLKRLLQKKEHMLDAQQEELLASLSKCLATPSRIFSALNNSDFSFGNVIDSQGNSHPLSHGTYLSYLESSDRTLRENAFKGIHEKFLEHENGLCEILYGHVQGHVAVAQARRYQDCLEASLAPKEISVNVYHQLIEAVRERLPSLHRYIRLRKKVLGLSQLKYFDLYVPLVKEVSWKISYEEGADMIVNAMAPLGKEYQKILQKGLLEERWVDRYENRYKKSGAYSSGCYDSFPYILMSYDHKVNDLFTLAHEAGHSMHSFYSRLHQPFHYADYTIFVAEVASTFDEELLSHYLLTHTQDPQKKAYIIQHAIESIRRTLFRQTLFAEFELEIHRLVEQKIPMTPQKIKDLYYSLNKDYFGPDLDLDDLVKVEWMRIPHFYSNFYVYQYATGISAALSLAQKVLQGGHEQRAAYLHFLQSGSHDTPVNILKKAGVDMCRKEPVLEALDRFDELLRQLESLI